MKVGATGLMTLLLAGMLALFVPSISFAGPIDQDGDGIIDENDNCPLTPNAGQEDADADTRGDACDNCRSQPNSLQIDTNGDGCGNQCDPDLTNDGIIGGGDFGIFLPIFGTSVPPSTPDADFNGVTGLAAIAGSPPDNIIGGGDFATFLPAFGGVPGPGLPADEDCDGVPGP